VWNCCLTEWLSVYLSATALAFNALSRLNHGYIQEEYVMKTAREKVPITLHTLVLLMIVTMNIHNSCSKGNSFLTFITTQPININHQNTYASSRSSPTDEAARLHKMKSYETGNNDTLM